jgi:hypothetical protein
MISVTLFLNFLKAPDFWPGRVRKLAQIIYAYKTSKDLRIIMGYGMLIWKAGCRTISIGHFL